jgi:hypothetical protein
VHRLNPIADELLQVAESRSARSVFVFDLVGPTHAPKPLTEIGVRASEDPRLLLRLLGGCGLGDLLDAHESLIPGGGEFAE